MAGTGARRRSWPRRPPRATPARPAATARWRPPTAAASQPTTSHSSKPAVGGGGRRSRPGAAAASPPAGRPRRSRWPTPAGTAGRGAGSETCEPNLSFAYVCLSQDLFTRPGNRLSPAPASACGTLTGVPWEEELFAVLDDLEQQAEALYDAERAAELADRSRAEYGAVTLASRLMASVGDRGGPRRHRGRPGRRASCSGSAPAGRWCTAPAATGSSTSTAVERGPRAPPRGRSRRWRGHPSPGSASARRSAGWARRGSGAWSTCADGARAEGRVLRVGADFAEVEVAAGARRAGRLRGGRRDPEPRLSSGSGRLDVVRRDLAGPERARALALRAAPRPRPPPSPR